MKIYRNILLKEILHQIEIYFKIYAETRHSSDIFLCLLFMLSKQLVFTIFEIGILTSVCV